jgi:hypothetical protein
MATIIIAQASLQTSIATAMFASARVQIDRIMYRLKKYANILSKRPGIATFIIHKFECWKN